MSRRAGTKTNTLSLAEKRDLLLAYEKMLAARMARLAIDKPKPPLWMILIPVFFVFFAMKMKEYKSGLKNFAREWMITRELALDTAYDAMEGNRKPAIEPLLSNAKNLKPEVLPHYQKWVETLVDYFCRLLEADGDNIEALIRSHYHKKSNLQLTLKHLARLEHAYLDALLPTLPGNQEELRSTIKKIKEADAVIQIEKVEAVFS